MRKLNLYLAIGLLFLPVACLPNSAAPDPTTLIPEAQPDGSLAETPSPVCETHTAELTLEVSAAEVRVGDVLAVTLVLKNEGCLALGIPQYRLLIEQEPEGQVVDLPEPVVHSLAVPPGGFDEIVFELPLNAPGDIALRASASFEVHVGYPGPAYWGSAASGEALQVRVRP